MSRDKDPFGPGFRRKLQKQTDQMLARLEAARESGAGFPIDQILRDFHNTANDRFIKNGPEATPFSFLVTNRFCREAKNPDWYPLLPERDHLFDFTDALMFAASDAKPKTLQDAAMLLPEGVIHSYTPVGDLAEDTSFRLDDGTRCAFCGVTMVRSGTELAMIILGGPILDDIESARQEILDLHQPGRSTYARLNPFADGNIPGEEDLKPTLVAGTDTVWQHIALVLVDITKPALLSRYLYIDDGKTYRIHSDDPSSYPFDDFDADNPPELITRSLKELERFTPLITLGVHMVALPAYFAYRRDVVQEERVQTQLGNRKNDRDSKRQMDLVPPGERPLMRRVSALRIIHPDRRLEQPRGHTDSRSYTPPNFQVEVDGFWRRLKTPTSAGHGPNGETTLGWTWVRSHMRWRNQPKSPGTIYVKSPLNPTKGLD